LLVQGSKRHELRKHLRRARPQRARARLHRFLPPASDVRPAQRRAGDSLRACREPDPGGREGPGDRDRVSLGPGHEPGDGPAAGDEGAAQQRQRQGAARFGFRHPHDVPEHTAEEPGVGCVVAAAARVDVGRDLPSYKAS